MVYCENVKRILTFRTPNSAPVVSKPILCTTSVTVPGQMIYAVMTIISNLSTRYPSTPISRCFKDCFAEPDVTFQRHARYIVKSLCLSIEIIFARSRPAITVSRHQREQKSIVEDAKPI